MIAQAAQMGDEVHNRNKAATSLFIREIASSIVKTDASKEDQVAVFDFLNSNDHFFLNLSMPAAKSAMDPVGKVKHSTIVYTMARNGTEFGIRVAALGDRWFTGPAAIIDGHTSRATARTMPTPTSATLALRRRTVSAVSLWRQRPRSCSSSGELRRTRSVHDEHVRDYARRA